MTEQEAIAVLKRDDDSMRKGYFCINDFIAIEVAIKALEEVEQYRAICTLEECRALKDRLVAKKVSLRHVRKFVGFDDGKCPTCGESVSRDFDGVDVFCPECGQRLDWSDEE